MVKYFALMLAAFLLAPEPTTVDDVVMIAVDGEGAKYWPRWRGPSGQGLAAGSGYVDKWSDTKNVKWKTKLDTTGNGSPIVWANRIFITTGSANGDSRGIAAFDRTTGTKLWETFAPDTNKQPVNLKNGHASSTPTTDGRLVYAYLGPKGVVAVDFTGKLAWHAPVGPMMAPHGPGGSPLLYKDRVIVFQDHQNGGFIAAFDAKTGARRWWTNRSETTGWSTPIAIRAGSRDEIIVSSFRAIYAYNPDTGDVLWKVTHPNPEVISTPVVGHGLVLASGGRPGPILAVRPGGSGDVTATHVAWQAAKGAPFVPSPLVYGDELYMLNDQASIVTAYDAKSGAVLWQGRLGEVVQSGFSASPVVVDGKIFCTNEGGETFVLKAGKTFELLHVNTLNEPVLASPAMVDGTWYFRTPYHLMAIGGSQNTPNFAGKWRADGSFNSWTIAVEGNTMTVTMTVAGNSESTEYLLDGTPAKKTTESPNGPLETVRTSTWEGHVLVTTTQLSNGSVSIERRWLEPDGTMRVQTVLTRLQGKPMPPPPPDVAAGMVLKRIG